MIIQCRQCNSNFKIDPQKLPSGKSFIRCSKCSASIPISPQEQDQVTNDSPKKLIQCEQCHVKYAVPLSHFKNDVIKMHCGKCGYVFRVNKDQPDEEIPSREKGEAELEIGLEDINISEDQSVEMNNLFDDISDENEVEPSIPEINAEDAVNMETSDEDSKEQTSSAEGSFNPQTPTEEYLDAIKLSTDENPDSIDFGLGTISTNQKYNFFLEPNKKIPTNTLSESQDFEDRQNWPEIQDEVPPPELLEEPADSLSETTTGESPEDDYAVDFEGSGEQNFLKENKKVEIKKKIGKLYVLVIFLILLLGVGGWFFIYMNNGVNFNNQAKSSIPRDQLVIMEPLRGKFVKIDGRSKSLFVLEGNIQSGFLEEADIHSIKVEGLLYKNSSETISSNSS
ncbi:MAG: hypothetical protein GY786_11280, partial [Proteobacteria bacterium]|nr:hypothetical protein [Pseudomonadota bacterium]